MSEKITVQSAVMLWKYLRPFRQRVLLLAILILAGIGLQLVAPQAIRFLLDAAQTAGELRLLLSAGAIYFVAVLSQKGLDLYANYLGEDLGWSAINQLRIDLAAHCIRLDMGFHKTRTPGELIERIDGDVSMLADYFSDFVVHILGNMMLAVGVLVLLFREDWRFGLIGLIYSILAMFLIRLLQKPMMAVSHEIRQGYAEMSGFLEERLGSTEDIRANGGELYVMNRFYPLMALISHKRIKSVLLGGLSFVNNYMLYVFSFVATLALTAFMFQQGNLSIGGAYIMVFYITMLESPLKYIRRRVVGVQRAFGSIVRINDLFKIMPQVQERIVATVPDLTARVDFDQVTFGYKDQLAARNGTLNGQMPTVLQDVSFSLEANRVLGVLGRTGSGKTTLTRLLFRLYDVDDGAIRLGGVNVQDVGLADLRRHVGMVTQDVQLFAATVRDNLTFFQNYDSQREPISDGRVISAIKELGLESWFNDLPDGLDTLLKSGGKGLSAGEAQLLAFTRVFLRDPRLIILDEASSRLDPATEQLLEGAIDRLLNGRSAIIIAHRLNTVQRADDILILENGGLVEHGSRISLANDPQSRFSQLLQTGMEAALV